MNQLIINMYKLSTRETNLDNKKSRLPSISIG